MSTKEEINYKDTLNLPQTDFPMKGDGPVRELEFQKFWEEKNIYKKMVEKNLNSSTGRFLLHDGPPYLSSENIHIGTALNKILKDIIVKYKTLRGYYSPYLPGYDCHGLPIESAVLKKEKTSRDKINPLELRKKCTEFANINKIAQEKKFKRLGVLGDWENAYMTLHPKVEAKQLELFGMMYEKGYIYRGLKSVYWCCECQTALAEAEVEYVENYKSPSIYVSFLINKFSPSTKHLEKYKDLKIVIWTTTPWTIPGNMAICLNTEFDYAVIKSEKFGFLLLAKELLNQFSSKLEETYEVLETVKGKDLEHTETVHPIYKRKSPVILGEHVTLETGTGCVHTAPGHGMEDFNVGLKYGLQILSPVNEKGCFTPEAGEDFKGVFTQKEGNELVINKLSELGALLKKEDYFHSYPHCWRSKTPIIFRATKQWFCSVEKFRKNTLDEINKVQWIPETGKNRIYSMVESRSDWCISRQRVWGVPIPAFYCVDCEEKTEKEKIHLSTKIIKNISKYVSSEGTNIWWEKNPLELLPENYKCDCGGNNFKKEYDTMDVWFDSGSTHFTVVDEKPELKGSPSEMYLEGSDQHRGWFQSSLLTSVAIKNSAPYKSVLTHGFVVDENGRKMSKSLGNVIDPDKVISQLGADILRLWVTSVDYSVDVRIGNNMLKQLSDVYRNIRNTMRFILGNLYDFTEKDLLPYSELWNIDKYALHKLEILKEQITSCMNDYQFFKYYQILQNFCAIDLSSFYFDLNKDRLYTSGKKSKSRRAVQTILYELLQTLVPTLASVLPHLAEDIWMHLPGSINKKFESALLLSWNESNKNFLNESLSKDFQSILAVKDEVYKALEEVRKNKSIGKSIETKISIVFNDKSSTPAKLFLDMKDELPLVFITSQVLIDKIPETYINKLENKDFTVYVSNADGKKCPRCWKHMTSIGTSPKHPTICLDCANAVDNVV